MVSQRNIQVAGGTAVAGFSVGILHVASTHPLLPGNVQHAQSYDFPVLFEEVPINNPSVLMRGDVSLQQPIADAALRLERRGVKAIVGACGSFSYYQKAIREAVNIPVFMSVLTQIPFLLQALPPRKKLAVICASSASMNERVYDQCNISDSTRLVIQEMSGRPEFDRMMTMTSPIDPEALQYDLLSAGRAALEKDPEVGAFLLQCSDLPPWGADLQADTGLPVFDATRLIDWLHHATNYPFYTGSLNLHRENSDFGIGNKMR